MSVELGIERLGEEAWRRMERDNGDRDADVDVNVNVDVDVESKKRRKRRIFFF